MISEANASSGQTR